MKLVVDNYVGHPFRFCYNGIPTIQDALDCIPTLINEDCEIIYDNSVGSGIDIKLFLSEDK